MKSYIEILEENNKKVSSKVSKYLKNKRIKFLLNFNNFQLQAFLEYYLKKKSINANFINSEFDQIFQQLNQIKFKDKIDILIVGNDYNFIYDEYTFKIKDFIENIKLQLETLKKLKTKKPDLEIIFFNLPYAFSQILQNKNTSEKIKLVNEINLEIKNQCSKNNFHLFDYNSIILETGQKNFYSLKNFYSSKSLFSEIGSNTVASEISKIIKSITYTRKKCLVLDLDNTLWGGILGEDGIHGIKVGNSFEGERYFSFQKYVKSLSDSGVILALASKNNISDVKRCFQENKNLFLKMSDFSSIKVNWNPKYKNINLIAEELNIGKDSIVFFDDSKFERDQMRKFNPEINVISVPEKVDNYIESIEDTAFFYLSKKITKEDQKKKYQYDIVSKAKSLKLKFKNSDNDKFLKSLKMVLKLKKIDNSNFLRCVQMLNKTNQFNLTTNRYTEATFKNYIKKNKIISLVIDLEDKFGSHGITGLVTGKVVKNQCIIENFLLSCRILGRGIESVVLAEFISKLKKLKIKNLIGLFKKTQKNMQCTDFYKKEGFEKISKEKYLLSIDKLKKNKPQIIKIIYEKN